MRTLSVCLCILSILLVWVGTVMAQAATELLWDFPTGWEVNSVAAIGDVSGNGVGDVLAGVSDDHVYCIEGGGPQAGTGLWSMTTAGDVWVVAAIADVSGDDRDDCLAGAADNHVYCLSGADGSLLWSFISGGDVWDLTAIGDVNGDGLEDCLAGGADNTVTCLSGVGSGSGQVLWQFVAGGDIRALARTADLDGDGREDCLAGASDNTVTCLSGNAFTTGPRQIWSYAASGDVWDVAAIVDVSGDGRDDCLAGTAGNQVLCLSGADGSLLWSAAVGGDVWSVAALGDADGDGTSDVLAGSADNRAYAFSGSDGAALWETAFGGDVWDVAAIGDIDGDARSDGLCGTGSDDIAVIGGGGSEAGQMLWSQKALGGIRTVAVCGDLNGNGRPDVIAGSTDSFVRAYEGNTVMAGVAAAESLALADLYHSAGGDGWIDRTGWLDGPVIDWHGVTVIDHHVVALQLDANGLSGTLPFSIGDLVHLEVLGLAANDLSGSIPDGIGGLENLKGLYLQNNHLSGAVPEGITGLSALQHLWIQDNRLEDLPGLGSLGGLTDLRVQSNRFTFEDIEPNVGVSGGIFLYSPQDSIGQAADTSLAPGQSITLSVASGGAHTRFQWTRDGFEIPGADQASYSIVSAAPGDAGRYVCRLTNTVAPELTLYSRPVDLSVTGVSEPAAGDLWLAGRTHTVRWQVDGSAVTITLSLDDGQTYDRTIAAALPNTGQYLWEVPDTILSRTCRIRVTGNSQPPAEAVSGSFRIKPYLLTRLTPEGQYEPYELEEDAWSFGNENALLWPESWWGGNPPRFDYTGGDDPVTGLDYPPELTALDPPPETFPDWPLWAEAFGTGRCYWDESSGRYRQAAVARWDACRGPWRGSSAGLALSSLMAFDDAARFQAAFAVGSFGNLGDLTLDDDRREAVNLLWTRSLRAAWTGHLQENWDRTPTQTLSELEEMLLAEAGDHRILYLVDEWMSMARAVVPISLSASSSPSSVDLAVYDPQVPGSVQTVRIDTLAGIWDYGASWGGMRGMILMGPVSELYDTDLWKGISGPDHAARDSTKAAAGPGKTAGSVGLYGPPNAAIRITDQNGDSLGWADGSAFDGLVGGIPIIPAGGGSGPPLGYRLLSGEYEIRATSVAGPRTCFRVFTDSVLFACRCANDAPDWTTRLFCGQGLGVSNPDGWAKELTLRTVLMTETGDRVFELIDIGLSSEDSLHVEAVGGSALRIVNAGAGTAYDLRLESIGLVRRCSFQHGGIVLSGQSSHLISPDWQNLTDQPVIISIDQGLDGSIDQTLDIYDERTAAGEQSAPGLPSEVALSQNYPNPFNPRTVLEYDLPRSGEVRMTIYNVLGQKVASPVRGHLPAGHHRTVWDASGFASGVYFARLEAGEYSCTVKMLLLR